MRSFNLFLSVLTVAFGLYLLLVVAEAIQTVSALPVILGAVPLAAPVCPRRPVEIKAMRDALAVQDAVNLAGILKSFHEATASIQWEAGTNLPSVIRRHPAIVLYMSKLCDLLQFDPSDYDAFSRAYNESKGLPK